MIAQVSGVISAVRGGGIVARVGNLGFEVRTTPQFLLGARIGDQVNLHTRMHVREDEISLFGFESDDELRVFDLLCTVSGIGPKIALVALGALGAQELARAISMGDEAALTSIPGVGSKTAKLILLTLTGKLDLEASATHSNDQTVVSALVGLGVSTIESEKLVATSRTNLGHEATNAELLKESLRLRRQ